MLLTLANAPPLPLRRLQDTGDALLTGFGDMQEEYADLHEERSQFKLHYLGGKMVNEKVIRLPNGFPTTKREKDAFEAVQEANMKIMAEKMGIVVPRAKNPSKKVGGERAAERSRPKRFRPISVPLQHATPPPPAYMHTNLTQHVNAGDYPRCRWAETIPALAGAHASSRSAAAWGFRIV